MAKRNIIVMGGSTGSFEVFKTIAAELPGNLDAALFIVRHMASDVGSTLPAIFNDIGELPAIQPKDNEVIETGRIYLARPDHHMLIEDGRVRITRGPKENRFRPAIDPLFRSAAYSYGPRAIGVVTSGALDDGTSGLWEIKNRGGIAIVQDPFDAESPSMPENAIGEVAVDHVVPACEIAGLIVELSQQEVNEPEVFTRDDPDDEQTRKEINVAVEDDALEQGLFQHGQLTPFTCPECSGVLAKLNDSDRARFRCHAGHAFSADTLLAALTENIEMSLWSAVRGVDESIMLLNQLGDHFAEMNNSRLAAQFFRKANEARACNGIIRRVVFDHELLSTDGVEQEAKDMPPSTHDQPAEFADRGAEPPS
jgi:two-component system chemotaxis response regulator CheB